LRFCFLVSFVDSAIVLRFNKGNGEGENRDSVASENDHATIIVRLSS